MSSSKTPDIHSCSTSSSPSTAKSAPSPVEALSKCLVEQGAYRVAPNSTQFNALLLNLTPTLGQFPGLLSTRSAASTRTSATHWYDVGRPPHTHPFIDEHAGKEYDEEKRDKITRDINGHVTPLIINHHTSSSNLRRSKFRSNSALSDEDSLSEFSHRTEPDTPVTTPPTSPLLNVYRGSSFDDGANAEISGGPPVIGRKAELPIRKPLPAPRRPAPTAPPAITEYKPVPKSSAAPVPGTKRRWELASGSINTANKKQALVYIHTPPNMVKLVGWKNELVRVEEIAYQGKEGYGEIKQLMKPSALPDMERHTHVPADWIKAPIHLREEAG